jgi:hypothetical protein
VEHSMGHVQYLTFNINFNLDPITLVKLRSFWKERDTILYIPQWDKKDIYNAGLTLKRFIENEGNFDNRYILIYIEAKRSFKSFQDL